MGTRTDYYKVHWQNVEWATYVVNIEEEGVVDVLRGCFIGNPVQFVY